MAMASSAPACAASELVARGRESAAVLQALLLGQQPAVGGASATPHGLRELTDQILRCCDRALAALRHGGTEEDADAAGGIRKRKQERGPGPAAPPATSSKRRRVRGGEMGRTRVEKRQTTEDGFIWRKYGQKDIHGSKYPRLYFRCTYKEDHGCVARRQVQQWDADPSFFLITYFGDHTCCREDDEPPAPFVINFGSSSSDGQPSGSPWPSSDDDGLVLCKTPGNSPEEEVRSVMDNESELIDLLASVPELTSMSSMEWDLLDGCLDWTLCDGRSPFDSGDEFIGQDFDYLGLL